ncbi:MAG: phosphodiester glycosidase family protein [Candidatus Sericytochromatia bacterium]|uniref:Phosphodiester glycosidase family protein n=1 Tax=Candidatus Tanganyikabacteria bacterium TaxID=2961651 RepID=A0A937X3T5_9BACT|nr:phosphodiester glycosidase family protein [Candidatus Tanganyikabacteria bacterium]
MAVDRATPAALGRLPRFTGARPAPLRRLPTLPNKNNDLLDAVRPGPFADWQPIAAGVRYSRISHGGRNLHALELAPGVPLSVWIGSPTGSGSSRLTATVPEMAKNAVLALNGSFSSPADAPISQALGPVIRAGRVEVNSATSKPGWGPVPRSFIGWGVNGGAFIGETRAGETGEMLRNRLNQEGRMPCDVLGGLGSLLIAGRLADDHARNVQGLVDGQASNVPNARTLAGLTPDGRVIVLIQEGDAGQRQGAGVRQLGQMLQALGATEGVILDGGGTAQVVIPSRQVDSRAGQHQRQIPTGLRLSATG